MSTTAGSLLSDRYRLDEQVGAGGMSRVWSAFDTLLERRVAVKTLNNEVASDSGQIERFRREARAVAKLSHPHIVTVIDAGTDDGTPYIVFEYVEGETLKQRIRRLGRLPVPEAVAYAIEIARALGAAHAQGIVHRDVKPQNILIDRSRRAKITDFGIARVLEEDGLTADGRVLGTTDYVSPEQALGHDVSGQSDIYSLGIVLYEMLTGSPPFKAENQVAVAMKHVREEIPDVQAARPEVSADLAALVDRATDKDLRRRYASAEELIADLEQALATETMRGGEATGEVTMVLRTLPGPLRRRLPLRLRSRRSLVAGLLVAAVAIAVVVAFALDHAHRGTGTPAGAAPPPAQQPVSVAQDAAHSYNPFGNEPEHADTAGLIVDGDPTTYWSTFHYQAGALAQKGGTGIYVDASPGVAARSAQIQTPTAGFNAQVYGAQAIAPAGTLAQRGWTLLATQNNVAANTRIALDTAGKSFRYYLLWITSLPPNQDNAEVGEFTLYR